MRLHPAISVVCAVACFVLIHLGDYLLGGVMLVASILALWRWWSWGRDAH